MTKRSLYAVLSATAMLTIAGAFASFASGWDNSTGSWKYVLTNGDYATNTWKQSGDKWFYLGDDGVMAKNTIFQDDDDYYAVDENGVMITNRWIQTDVNNNDTDDEYRWMYFGSDGKAKRDKNGSFTKSDLVTINGKKYAFDEDGNMLYGWIGSSADVQDDDDLTMYKDSDYYFGGADDGALTVGWKEITVEADEDKDDKDTFWFYFDASGKKVKDNSNKKIDGKQYAFDSYGRMLDEWANATASNTLTSSSSVIYLDGDGSKRKNTWVWAVPDEDYDQSDNDSDEYSWWYTGSNGSITKNQIKKINGKKYAFDSIGRMLYGVVVDDGSTLTNKNSSGDKFTEMNGDDFARLTGLNTVYFFSNDEEKDGSMKTGEQTVAFDDDDYKMYLGTNGYGTTGYTTKVNKFTSNGIILKANNTDSNYAGVGGATYDGGYKLTAYTGMFYSNGTQTLADDGLILVNTSGIVQKKKTNLKDANDVYYVTDKNGVVLYDGTKKVKKSSSTATGAFALDVNADGTIGSDEYFVEYDD